MSASILLIDDEAVFREDLALLLADEGFTCRTAADGHEGIRRATEEEPDVVLCDLTMPGLDGVEVIDRLSVLCPEATIFVVTAFGTMETAVEAFRKGAADYLLKPVVPEDLIRKIRRCVDEKRLRREIRYLRRVVAESATGTKLIGDGPAMQNIKQLIARVGPAQSTVLVRGASGTGKELVARALHDVGKGPDAPFVALNCSALPRELVESELFGHVRGAFTGAARDRAGHFELASGGTLLLDEIGELPAELQPKLLRALEAGEITRVGGSRPRPIDVRIIAATNRDLEAAVAAGVFREDLYYRLKVIEIELPPLRERRHDIPLLADHLIHRLNRRLGRHVLGIDHAAMQIIMGAEWKGNVRELENVLERAILLSESEYLGIADLPPDLAGALHCPALSDDLRQAVRSYEAQHIRHVLDTCDGNREIAAQRLGVNPSTLYRRLKDLGLKH